jgi:hypothetical protein
MPIVVLDPTSHSEAESPRLAPALLSLTGRLVGVLDNGKANADRLLREVETLLRQEYGVREFIYRRKSDFSRPAPAALLAELRACDALITAVGD